MHTANDIYHNNVQTPGIGDNGIFCSSCISHVISTPYVHLPYFLVLKIQQIHLIGQESGGL